MFNVDDSVVVPNITVLSIMHSSLGYYRGFHTIDEGVTTMRNVDEGVIPALNPSVLPLVFVKVDKAAKVYSRA